MTIEQVVDKQMQAFNARDISDMMAVFSEDITIINFPDGKILVDGIEACKKMYSELFNLSPNLHAEILKTIVFDNIVIVDEFIFGRNGSDRKVKQLIIFEVKHEKINRINVTRKEI